MLEKLTSNLNGNISTIIKFLVLTIAPAFGVDEATGNTIATIIAAIIGFIIAYDDAKNPNNFKILGNEENVESE